MADTWVAFDAMGVLYRAGDDVAELLIPFLRERGSTATDEAVEDVYLRASRGEVSAAELWAALGLPDTDDADYLQRHELTPGVPELLADLRAAGVRVACLANDLSAWSDWLREHFGLDDLIDEWVVSADIGCRKPTPAAFEALLMRLDVEPAQVVFFDDRDANVAGADALGMDARDFTDAATARAQLVELGLL